ncbi:aldose epimerase family protein [Tranquillimonas alkanivorans]|uniref:Aldose 1-epimerase n=1 Tax=Tranquillimonas alkanivorans TaxID=441119 RepID=A0A1I5MZS1_9RHOB|nr:aldose epimerase family protein [Tranquillimonas alkanivorans]SFP15125.1 aldose 1-epimerase [Tranquillimonas alkanivorans]
MTPDRAPFGILSDGRTVDVLTLRRGPLTARVLTLGAILQDLRLDGHDHALTLGSPDLSAYEGPLAYFGAVVGPVANRIAGAQARVCGEVRHFEANQGGRHTLHSGSSGLHAQVWEVVDQGADFAVLAVDLADGTGGFPGNRRVMATYRLTDTPGLSVRLEAETDADTLMNLAHHGYWTMDGGATWEGQRLQVLAHRYLPVDGEQIPRGEVASVEGTPFDFREPREATEASAGHLDHNYCLAEARRGMTPALRLTGRNGLTLEVATTEPGLQVFGAATLHAEDYATHHGTGYGPFAAFAIEPQVWPDAPNHNDFPSVLLRPGERYEQETEFRFLR